MTNIFRFSNPHPKGKRVGDCVKRAFTHATGRDYKEVANELNRIKRSLDENYFNSDKVWRAFIKKEGWTKISFPVKAGQPRLTARDIAIKYPKGTYVLRMKAHLATIINGQLLDTWDSSSRMVYNMWKVN